MDPTTVQPYVFLSDRQPESGPTDMASPGGVRSPEAVEKLPTFLEGEPDAMITYRKGHHILVLGEKHIDWFSLAVFDRIAQKVSDQPSNPSRIRANDA
jgi:hypothetical protein